MLFIIKNEDFYELRELLYQIYPTHRPINSNFQLLTKAAINFDVKIVKNRLIDHIINYDNVNVFSKHFNQ